MTVRVSCPFCNAGGSLDGVPPGGRVLCPRCGEKSPVRGSPTYDAASAGLPEASVNGTPVPPAPPVPDIPPARSLLSLGLIGLALAAAVLGGGLYYVLRPSTPRADSTKPADTTGPGTVPPTAVAGLVYLPADTSRAFAVPPVALPAYAA